MCDLRGGVAKYEFYECNEEAATRLMAADLFLHPYRGMVRGVSIQAVVENDLVRLPSGVHLPDGTRVRLEVLPSFKGPSGWPDGYFQETAGRFEGERFDRPSQGELPLPVSW
jgi:hypothetical protein